MQISPISCRRSANRAPPIRFSVVNCQPKRCADVRPVRPYMRFIVFQSHPYCAVKWVRLHANMAVIGTQGVSRWLSIWLTWWVTRMHVGTLTLNIEFWTLTFMISPIIKMICKQEACRDARLVRPLKTLRVFVLTTMLFACHSYCADARTNVYWLTFPTERTHGPCVPTCLLPPNHFLT